MQDDKVIEIALKALNFIADPIKHLNELAEADGTKLDGHAALVLGKDSDWLRSHAKRALQQIAELKAVGGSTSKTPAGACVYTGGLDAMFFTHTSLVSNMMLRGSEINSITRARTRLPLQATIGFRDGIAKLMVLTTAEKPAVTAVIYLHQDLKELGLAADCADGAMIQGALSCQHCVHKHKLTCGNPNACKAAHEHGQYRTCEAYNPNDECLTVLARVVKEWAAVSGEHVE